jgi:uncharacterized protein YkwD
MEILGILITVFVATLSGFLNQKIQNPLLFRTRPAPTSTPVLSNTPTPGSYPTQSQKRPTSTPDDSEPWGVAKKIGDYTYTMKIQNEDRMSTPTELLSALNDYRIKHGSQPLRWEEKLCSLAQERAEFQAKNGLDAHQGFNDFLENQDGFNKLGFGWLGENASQGYIMSGQHLVEFIFASDEGHDQNQLATQWDRTCIAIVGSTVEIIFATSPI